MSDHLQKTHYPPYFHGTYKLGNNLLQFGSKVTTCKNSIFLYMCIDSVKI